MKVKPIRTSLPVLGFEGDILISNSLDMGFGLRLFLPELLSCSAEKLYLLHDTFQRVVSVLPENTLLHKQDFFFTEEYSSKEGSRSRSGLGKDYHEHFQGRRYLKHECYLYVSLLNVGLLKNYLGSSLIFSRKARLEETRIREKIRELQINLASILGQSGIESIPVSREQAMGTANEIGLIERYLTLNFREGQPLLGGIDFRDRLRVMDRFVEMLSLSDYSHLPSEVHPVSGHPRTGIHGLSFVLAFAALTHYQPVYLCSRPADSKIRAGERLQKDLQSVKVFLGKQNQRRTDRKLSGHSAGFGRENRQDPL